MSERRDLLKSLLRGAAAAARRGVDRVGPVAKVREAIRELGARRAVVGGEALNAALARAPGVTSVMARAHDGLVRIDATFDDGRAIQLALRPAAIHFAPRGAKELAFAVDPPELAADTRVHALALATATAIVHALWAPALRGAADESGYASADREGALLRIDLRSLPVVRTALRNRATAMLLDAITLVRMHPNDGRIELELRLPGLGGATP